MPTPVSLGADDQSVYIRILDSTTFLPLTTVTSASAGLALVYKKGQTGAVVAITESDLAGVDSAHADGGMKHVDAGVYRVDLPDAAVPTIEGEVTTVSGAVTGGIILPAALIGVQAIGAPAGASVSADLATLLGKLAGITVLANWLRGMVRKDAMDATAKAELNAGGGTYNEATDSPEAIRDRGDAAWTTATGFSTLAAQDVRDAMKLAPSAGDPTAGSVDKHLDDIPTTAPLTAAGTRTALGMAAADMDTQLDAILAASGGSVGPVNHTVTITDGADPVDNARVYLTSDLAGVDTLVIVAGTFLTNSSGQYQFLGLDAATYYWLHVEKAGFNFTPVRFQTDAS